MSVQRRDELERARREQISAIIPVLEAAIERLEHSSIIARAVKRAKQVAALARALKRAKTLSRRARTRGDTGCLPKAVLSQALAGLAELRSEVSPERHDETGHARCEQIRLSSRG